MEKDRTGLAIERIEAALTRIGSAADRIKSAPPSGDAITAAKESLRSELAGTLNDLDALIESIEQ
jgi:hypothetical protein